MSAHSFDPSSPPATAIADAGHGRSRLIGWVAFVLLAPAALIYLSFNAGGYFPATPGIVAIVLATALMLRTMLAQRPFEGLSRTLAIPLVALALYAGWALASEFWAHATARVLDSYDRTLLYVLAFVLFGSVRYTRQRLSWLARVSFVAMVAVCLIGLISRTLPHTWPTSGSFFDERLNYPLTYWNAEGMLAAMALILGFHLSADRAERWSVRVLAAALVPGIAATLLLTFSRGALGVTAIGLVAYCLLTRLSTLPSALLAIVAPTAIALHSAWDATLLATKHATTPHAISQGHHVAVVVGVCMLAAGFIRAVMLVADQGIPRLSIVRTPPNLAIRAGIGAVIGVIVVAVALGLGVAGFVEKEYDKFVQGTREHKVAQVRERLTDPANHGRLPLWEAALDTYKTQKLRGTGAGTFQQYYPRYRTPQEGYVSDAHSLYLQSLSELGIVGFILILVVVIGILGGLASRIRGPDRGIYAALFAIVLAWAVHQAFDWDWQMPATTLPIFILAGMALARPAGPRGLRGLPINRSLVAIGWLVLAVCPLLVSVSFRRLEDASDSLRHGQCVAAKSKALSSLSFSAERPQAYAIIGVCDLEQGFAQAAVSAMGKAATYEPNSWEDQYWLAIARANAGVDPHAAMQSARELNPLEPLLKHAAKQLSSNDPRTWERVAPSLRHSALESGKFTITSL